MSFFQAEMEFSVLGENPTKDGYNANLSTGGAHSPCCQGAALFDLQTSFCDYS